MQYSTIVLYFPGTIAHTSLPRQIMNGIELGCSDFLEECPAKPCVHGVCKELVTGYECDCADTDYTGKNCDVGECGGSAWPSG